MPDATMTMSSIADITRVHRAERPDSPAIDFEGRTLTFRELDDRANRLANALAALGVGAADRVAFLDKNGPAYFETLFGAAKLQAVLVALNWRLAPGEMAQILNDARASVLIVGPEFVSQIEKIESELPTVQTIIALGEHARWTDYEGMLEGSPATDPDITSAGDDVAIQLYTSGTTGLPKGAMLTNANFFDGVLQITDTWRITQDSVSLAVLPMFHISGTGWSLAGLYQGARTVVLREVDLGQILQAIPEFGVTNALLVPAIIQMIVDTPGIESTDFSSLRAIAYGAAPVTDSVLTRALEVFGCEFIQLYGLTETTGPITQLDPADHDPVHRPDLLRSCGKPYPWVELRIVDAETGRDVQAGEVGELWTRSPQNMLGYWANESATRATITDDGWLKTGDAGYRDADGFFFLHDRVKDMIVSGGENIYPAEVENVLAGHPDVIDVAVIGVPDDVWGEAVKAVIVRREGSSATGDDFIAFAREHLAGFKLPKSVDFADVLPRNPSGKLLKREIRAPYWDGHHRNIG